MIVMRMETRTASRITERSLLLMTTKTWTNMTLLSGMFTVYYESVHWCSFRDALVFRFLCRICRKQAESHVPADAAHSHWNLDPTHVSNEGVE